MMRFSILCTFLLFALGLQAQKPSGVQIQGADNRSVQACPPGQGNFAGTFSLGTFVGQSNDTDLDTVFLCFGDSIFIDHNGDQSFAGDPIPGTAAGVGYAFYTCPPTVDAEELGTIITDPCLATNTMPPPGQGLWIATGGGALDGDFWFVNDGSIQDFFFNGQSGVLWFAPITYDAYDAGNPADPVVFENGGPCVNVNIDAAFAVAYLNPITPLEIVANGCNGNICVAGGLPELDGANSDYSVNMSLVGDPTVQPDINIIGTPDCDSAAAVRNIRFFNAPQAGIYEVTISDGKSCSSTFQVNVPFCQEVTFDVDESFSFPGDTVCVPIEVTNFDSVQSFQFSLNFDTAVIQLLQPNALTNLNPDLTDNGLYPVFTGPANPNQNAVISFSWFFNLLSTSGVSLPDGAVLFEICFEVVGDVGDVSPITFDTTALWLAQEVTNARGGRLNFGEGNGSVTVIDSTALTVIIDKSDVRCGAIPPATPASNDGEIILTPFGGLLPYTYQWQEEGGPIQGPFTIDNPGTPDTIANLAAGTYIITVEDSKVPAEVVIDTIEILEPAGLGVNPNATDPVCFGDSTGTFNINVNGGVLPYSFSWNNGATTQNLSNIPAGFYQVTVTDANDCTATAAGTLFNPPQLTTSTTKIDATCTGINDGQANVTAIGGTVLTDYTYAWSTNPVQTTSNATGLAIQQYFVTVTDDNGCSAIDSVNIDGATVLELSAVITDPSCFGFSDGSIDITPVVTGIDNGGYTYIWAGGVAPPNSNIAQNLPADTIFVLVSDALGCSIDSSFIVNEPDSISITQVDLGNETCPTGMNGFVEVQASGGTINPGSDYQYDWSNLSTGPLNNNLNAGTYSVTVTDDNSCQDSATFEILPPIPPVIDSFQVTDVACATSTDGAITVFATPGAASIVSYSWTPPNSGATITGLAPGQYIVTVTDASSCSTVDTAVVQSPPPLELVDTTLNDPVCFGDDNGSIALTLAGGTPPYDFQWSDMQTTNPAVNLSAGQYSVTITDANSCPPLVVIFNLEDPAPVSVTFDPASIQPVSCFGGIPCDGQATAIASGGGAGTGVYTYNWSSGFVDANTATSTATDLCSGFQSVIVSDAQGCFTIDSVEIPSPPELLLDTAATAVTDVSCFGESDGSITAQAQGGTPPYNYNWPGLGTTGASVSGLNAGTYSVEITDANGCQTTANIQIEEPQPLTLTLDTLNTTNETCAGDMDGMIGVIPAGGNLSQGPPSYNWSGNVSVSDKATNLGVGTYTVTVTDVRGCTATLQHTITAPPPIIAEFQDTLPMSRCFGEAVTINVDTIFGGGFPAYETTVNNFDRRTVLGFPHAITVLPGNNVVTVIDGNGCQANFNIFIEEPPEILVDLGPDFELDLGDFSRTITPVFPNGQSVQSFDSIGWSPAGAIDEFLDSIGLLVAIAPLETTTYTLTVIDTNGCVGTGEVTVRVNRQRNVFIPNVFSPNDDGFNDEFSIVVGQDVRQINFLQVFDRWGELVYGVDNFLPDSGIFWDGTFNGEDMNPGVYVYLAEVEFVDGRVLLYRGTITLVR